MELLKPEVAYQVAKELTQAALQGGQVGDCITPEKAAESTYRFYSTLCDMLTSGKD